jgi:hypothetical protein
MSHAHSKPKGASLHTIIVYEENGAFVQYAGAGRHPVAVYDRERSVLETARRIGEAIGAETIRVLFIVPVEQGERSEHPPTPTMVKTIRSPRP